MSSSSAWVSRLALIETWSAPSPPIAKILSRTRNVTSVSQVSFSSASGRASAIRRTSSNVVTSAPSPSASPGRSRGSRALVEPDRADVCLGDVQDHPLDAVLGGPAPRDASISARPMPASAAAVEDATRRTRPSGSAASSARVGRVGDVDRRRADHPAVDDRGDVLDVAPVALDPASEAVGGVVPVRDAEAPPGRSRRGGSRVSR